VPVFQGSDMGIATFRSSSPAKPSQLGRVSLPDMLSERREGEGSASGGAEADARISTQRGPAVDAAGRDPFGGNFASGWDALRSRFAKESFAEIDGPAG
jgi:hypothetical protein